MGIYLVVQWLRLPTSTAGDMDPIPGQGTSIPICHTAWQKIFLKKQKCMWSGRDCCCNVWEILFVRYRLSSNLRAYVRACCHVWLFATPWTVACQALLCMGFSRQEYWSGLPCPPPGDVPNPEIIPMSPSLQADSLPSDPPGKPMNTGAGYHALLQGIILTQGFNPCL